jgi:hypothetical protein
MQHEPGVAGTLADAAVRDSRLALVQSGVGVDSPQLVSDLTVPSSLAAMDHGTFTRWECAPAAAPVGGVAHVQGLMGTVAV